METRRVASILAALAAALGVAFALPAAAAAANADDSPTSAEPVPTLDPEWSASFVPPPLPRLRAGAACRPLNAIFFTQNDWYRLAQKLRGDPSPCAQYYVAPLPLTGDKTQLRKGEAAKIRALGPMMHAVAEISVTGWTQWVNGGNGSWYDAGVTARQRMVDAGYDVAAGDIWGVDELSSAVRANTGAARANMRDLIRGLYTGDGTTPPVQGVVWVSGMGQSTTDLLSQYKPNLKAWYQDAAFFADMSTYVRFWSQETYGDVKAWAVPGTDLATRRDQLTAYLEHAEILAEVSPAAAAGTKAYLRGTDTPGANAAWAYISSYGNTLVPPALMKAFVAAQVDALRHYQAGQDWRQGDSFGFAWAPTNDNINLPDADYVAGTTAILDQLAASIHASDAVGEDAGLPACGPDGSWCAGDLVGASFNPAWQALGTWTQPVARDSSATLVEDTSVAIPLAASDADGDALAFTIVTPPAHGALTGDGAAQTYAPASDFNGRDSFTFRVSDGFMSSRLATVTITVTPANDVPTVALAPAGPVDEGAAPVDIAATASDADGDALTYVWTTDAGTLVGTGPTATFTAADGPALAHVGVEVSDGHGGTAGASIAIEVRNVPPTVDAGGARQAPWGVPIAFGGQASDVAADTASLTASWDFGDGTAPAPTLAASHAYALPGTYVATLTVRDKDGASAADTATVTIEERPLTLAYTGPVRFERWKTTLGAQLTDAIDPQSARLGGHVVTLAVGGQTCGATTDVTGLAACELDASPLPPGPAEVMVAFAGDGLYAPASRSAPVAVYAEPPVIAASATSHGAPYEPGRWTAHPVVVTFTCGDEPGGSGLAAGTGPVAVTVAREGAAQTVVSPSGFCSDNAGNVAAPLTFGAATVAGGVDVDWTAPAIHLSAPVDGAVYGENRAVVAGYACTDGVSGVASCAAAVPDAAPLDTANGPHSFTVTAVDAAGNSTDLKVSYVAAAQLGKGSVCDRYFTGRGKDVTVPRGAVCHLVAGATVTHDLRVVGATLVSDGASVGHDLELKEPVAATVCASSVGHDLRVVRATAGPVAIGDTGTGGCTHANAVGHDLVVERSTAVVLGDNAVRHKVRVKPAR